MDTDQKIAFLKEYIREKDKTLIDATLNYQMWTSIVMKESKPKDDALNLQYKYKMGKESLEILIRQAKGMLQELENTKENAKEKE